MARYRYGEGMFWFEKAGHHTNFVAGMGMLCTVLWYASDLIADGIWSAILKGIFGFSAALLLGDTLIMTWKFAQKLWK